MQVKLQDFRWPTNPLIRVMIFNLTARLITQVFPKIDIQARRQRFDQNTPANLLERCIFNIFDFILCLGMGLSFLFIHNFRDRVYYLYEHPDHDDDLCLYPRLTWRHPNTTKWVIYSFPKVKHFWSSCIRFSRDLKSLVPTYKSSPSFFRISPKLAVVIHGAGKRAGELKIIPNGCVTDFFPPAFLTFNLGLSEYITHLLSNVASITLNPNSSLRFLSIWPSLAQVLTWSRCTKSGDSNLLR